MRLDSSVLLLVYYEVVNTLLVTSSSPQLLYSIPQNSYIVMIIRLSFLQTSLMPPISICNDMGLLMIKYYSPNNLTKFCL